MSAVTTSNVEPVVVRDPRFRAGRELVGTPDAAEIFAVLLEQARSKYGADHVETAPAYYEYGNALFRAHEREKAMEEANEEVRDAEESKKAIREAAAAAAEQRVKKGSTASNNENSALLSKTAPVETESAEGVASETIHKDGADKTDLDVDGDDDSDDAVSLALEMMETAWSILDACSDQYSIWRQDQIPRVLTGIGDVLASAARHADSADAYLRALDHRQTQLEEYLANTTDASLPLLTARRKVVEVGILIAEQLLACDTKQDVVTTESQTVLVAAAQIVDYARGYYDKAREELQEALMLMGQLAGSGTDMGDERQDLCYVATMVMAVGVSLAEMDERAENVQTSRKKAKTK